MHGLDLRTVAGVSLSSAAHQLVLCFAFIRVLMSTLLLQGLDLLRGLFDRDPAARLTAAQAQRHPWFAAQLGWEAESLRITAELPAILDKVRVPGMSRAFFFLSSRKKKTF